MQQISTRQVGREPKITNKIYVEHVYSKQNICETRVLQTEYMWNTCTPNKIYVEHVYSKQDYIFHLLP